ncbi:hypothetical protein C8R44DRAFT_736885 [Mycena epipterygia]|nr:hypothetical protein C8R44DRAFT_736885 [Mycena epipterygia]
MKDIHSFSDRRERIPSTVGVVRVTRRGSFYSSKDTDSGRRIYAGEASLVVSVGEERCRGGGAGAARMRRGEKRLGGLSLIDGGLAEEPQSRFSSGLGFGGSGSVAQRALRSSGEVVRERRGNVDRRGGGRRRHAAANKHGTSTARLERAGSGQAGAGAHWAGARSGRREYGSANGAAGGAQLKVRLR